LRRAKRKIRARVQRDVKLNPPIIAAKVEDVEASNRVGAKVEVNLLDAAFILHNCSGKFAPVRDADLLRRGQRPGARNGL
jgi:hypothetical protein